MKKLFTVEITNEIVVLAENEVTGERIARSVIDSFSPNDFNCRASEMRHFPDGWEGDEIPYGENEVTVNELVESGHAPAYIKMKMKR